MEVKNHIVWDFKNLFRQAYKMGLLSKVEKVSTIQRLNPGKIEPTVYTEIYFHCILSTSLIPNKSYKV